MINNIRAYEMTSMPRGIFTGRNVSQLGPNPSLENWIWINECVRTAEIRGSLSPKAHSMIYGKSLGRKDDVTTMCPGRSKIIDWSTRLDSLLRVKFFQSEDFPGSVVVNGQIFDWHTQGTPESVGIANLIESKSRSGTFTLNPEMTPSLTDMKKLSSRASNLCVFSNEMKRSAAIAMAPFLDEVYNPQMTELLYSPHKGGFDPVFYGNLKWMKNGSESERPEKDTTSQGPGMFPWLYGSLLRKSRLASFYYRIKYQSSYFGNVDMTYSREMENPEYEMPYAPWQFENDGESAGVPYNFGDFIFGVWGANLYEYKTSQSSQVYEHEESSRQKFWAICPYGPAAYHHPSSFDIAGRGRQPVNIQSARKIGDEIAEILRVESNLPQDPPYGAIGRSVYDLKKIGYQIYIAPMWCLMTGSAQSRHIGS